MAIFFYQGLHLADFCGNSHSTEAYQYLRIYLYSPRWCFTACFFKANTKSVTNLFSFAAKDFQCQDSQQSVTWIHPYECSTIWVAHMQQCQRLTYLKAILHLWELRWHLRMHQESPLTLNTYAWPVNWLDATQPLFNYN